MEVQVLLTYYVFLHGKMEEQHTVILHKCSVQSNQDNSKSASLATLEQTWSSPGWKIPRSL